MPDLAVLERTPSASLQKLYDDVAALRPAAALDIVVGSPADFAYTGGGQHAYDDPAGGSEIRVAPHADELTVAHELLHAALLRRGYPVVLGFANLSSDLQRVRNAVDDAVSHPTLWPELRTRGFDDHDYWQRLTNAVSRWSVAEPAMTDGPPLFVNAAKISELGLASSVDSSPALTHCRQKYPRTWELSQEIVHIVERAAHGNFREYRRALVGLLRLLDTKLADEGVGAGNIIGALGASLVFSKRQLSESTRLHLAVESSRDQSSCAIIYRPDNSIGQIKPGELREALENELELTTREFAQNHDVYYTVNQ